MLVLTGLTGPASVDVDDAGSCGSNSGTVLPQAKSGKCCCSPKEFHVNVSIVLKRTHLL